MKVGEFALKTGPCFASSNEFKITIRGKGAHAALPHNGVDPVPVACQMVLGFQTDTTRVTTLKLNNDHSNLTVMTLAEHARLHGRQIVRPRDRVGRYAHAAAP